MRALLITLLAPLLWGTTIFTAQMWLSELNSYSLFLSAMRCLPAGLLLLAIGGWKVHTPLWKIAVLGVLNFSVFFSCLFYAGWVMPGGMAATLIAATPLVVVLFAWPVLGDKPHVKTMITCVVGMAGVAIMVLNKGDSLNPLGLLACFIALLSWPLGIVLGAKWTKHVNLMPFTAWQLLFGGGILLVASLFYEGVPPSVSPAAWGSLAWLSFATTGVAYLAWFYGLDRCNMVTVSMLALASPLIAYILDIVWKGIAPGVAECCGAVLILAAIAYQNITAHMDAGKDVQKREIPLPHESEG